MSSPTALPADPQSAYTDRLARATARSRQLERWEAWLRLTHVLCALTAVLPLLGGLTFRHAGFVVVQGLAVLAFIGLVYGRLRLRSAARRCAHRVEFYQRGLARLDGRWPGTGNQGLALAPVDHPYAADLDLFGWGSLFERLSAAQTRAGAQTLADWLLQPADSAEIQARQTVIDDLRPQLDLREEIYLLGAEIPPDVDLEALIRWGTEPPALPTPRQALLQDAVITAGVLALLLLIDWSSGRSESWLGIAVQAGLLGQALFCGLYLRRVSRVVAPLQRRAADLALFAGLLRCIERTPFRAAALTRLQSELRVGDEPPSRRIRRVQKLAGRLDLMANPALRWLGWLEMRTTRVAFALEHWRRTDGPRIGAWLRAVAWFEAYASLAAYAYENPADPFAELVAGEPRFEAENLGHPLLPRARCVGNDVCLDAGRRALIVTGSNMSGKTTLLRSVGVNAVLALAGAPVRARRLRLSPLAIGASVRVQDSLHAGQSRFLAELRRLRQIVDLTRGQRPLLFLIDEVLQGTNPHDRQHGAAALLVGLVQQGAIGLVTTHDLPLTALAEQPDVPMVNVHFTDWFEAGQLRFDYRMRPGVTPRSNALALMREVGLLT